MNSHLHAQLPLATGTRRDDVAAMLAVVNEVAEQIIVTLEHAERTLGRDHNPQVSQTLRHANKLIEAHGVESIVDRDYWVDAYFGNSIAVYINLGDSTLPTILFDTTDDEFYLTSPDDWLRTYEEARFQDELATPPSTSRTPTTTKSSPPSATPAPPTWPANTKPSLARMGNRRLRHPREPRRTHR